MLTKRTVSFFFSEPPNNKPKTKMDRDYEQHEFNLDDESRKMITTKTTTVTPVSVAKLIHWAII